VIPYAALIEFTDHCHIAPGTWTPIDELEEVGSCGVLTVGWVIADTADTHRDLLIDHRSGRRHRCVRHRPPMRPTSRTHAPRRVYIFALAATAWLGVVAALVER